MSVYDLIIFDCDGTLVDSEYLNNKTIADMLAALGLPQYTAEYNIVTFAGKGMQDVVETVQRETGRALPETFIADYTANVNVRMPELMKTIDGVADTLRHCHGRVKICVGSNGERANVLRMIEVGGFGDIFPEARIFTKSMVKNPKPAPDLFLLAAEKMGADPARTLVIEDSGTGARAGVAAGMTVIGFTGAYHDRAAQEDILKTAGAHHITNRFRDIVDFLARERAA